MCGPPSPNAFATCHMSTGLESLRILLVDDNPHMRAIVFAMLHGLGIKALHEARDGEQALERIRHNPVDLALVDFLMRPVDGVHFTREVRNSPRSPDIYLPIIMMTGHSERSRVEEARDAGVTEFVVKPLTVRGLVSRIDAAIQRPRPFVRTQSYFGPDRRRRKDPDFCGPWNRRGDPGMAPIEEFDTFEL